jgi:hypothetical protein
MKSITVVDTLLLSAVVSNAQIKTKTETKIFGTVACETKIEKRGHKRTSPQ